MCIRDRNHSIGDEGAKSFSQAVRVNTFLSLCDLFSSSIGDEGVTSLAQALEVNTSVSSLHSIIIPVFIHVFERKHLSFLFGFSEGSKKMCDLR